MLCSNAWERGRAQILSHGNNLGIIHLRVSREFNIRTGFELRS